MTFGDIFSEINLDSSIIYVIILTNLILLASKLGVPTLNKMYLLTYLLTYLFTNGYLNFEILF